MTLDQGTTPALLHAALPGADGGKPPAWVHLIPAGIFRGADGRGPYALNDPAGVVAAMRAELPLPIDEMHATDLGGSSLGMAAPARGWIVEMQARPDGIWGRVEWTKGGAALLAERAYRHVSPTLVCRSKDNAVIGLLRASLVNAPNLRLTALHSQGTAMDLAKRLRLILGLLDAATDDDIIIAVQQMAGDRNLHARGAPSLAGLTREDRHVAQMMGVDEGAFLREKLRAARDQSI